MPCSANSWNNSGLRTKLMLEFYDKSAKPNVEDSNKEFLLYNRCDGVTRRCNKDRMVRDR